jgi:hypothetical protein
MPKADPRRSRELAGHLGKLGLKACTCTWLPQGQRGWLLYRRQADCPCSHE